MNLHLPNEPRTPASITPNWISQLPINNKLQWQLLLQGEGSVLCQKANSKEDAVQLPWKVRQRLRELGTRVIETASD